MGGDGLRGGRIGRCLALAALAPLALGNLAAAQPAAAPPVLAIPAAPVPPPPPVEIPSLTPAQAQVALKALRAADLHGLQPKAYVPEGMPEDGALNAAQQVALADGLVKYAH